MQCKRKRDRKDPAVCLGWLGCLVQPKWSGERKSTVELCNGLQQEAAFYVSERLFRAVYNQVPLMPQSLAPLSLPG